MKLALSIIIIFLITGCVQRPAKIPVADYKTLTQQVIDSLKQKSEEFYTKNLAPVEFDNYIKEAIAVAKNSDNNEELFNLYLMVARRYRKASKFGEAIELLQNALNVSTLSNNDLLKATAIHEMAVNFRRINDNAQALKLHMQALELAENVNDTFLIHCSYNGAGNVYFEYKDYKRAIAYFHKSLQFLGEEKPNILGEAINSNLLGEAWLALGNTDSALFYLNRSFAANEKIGSEMGKGICHNGMGLVYTKKEDYAKAISEFHLAIDIYEKLGLKYYRAMSLNDLGSTYMQMGNFKMAQKTLKSTYNLATEIGGKRFALEASMKLAQIYNELGDSKKSYFFSSMSMAYKDSITTELQQQNTEATNVLYKAEKQEREIVYLRQNAELARLKMNRQQNIFYAAVGVAIVFALFVLLAYRQRRLSSRLNEIGLEQKLLRAQLNPHFVFNSLSAVQNFILKNDKKAASDYLVNFSRLMRNILMGSGTDFILLDNELEMLDDYLKLQRLRFQEKFDYNFEIADDIDRETCLVPPMLIQPFVENSIEHGVRDIDKQGKIVIRFKKNSDKLIIEVEDNGRGIADQKETEQKKGHISMATKITKQRMQNLQAITKKACKFEVIDNFNQKGVPGVSVFIELPFQEEL